MAIKTILHSFQTALSIDKSIARQKFKIRRLEPRLNGNGASKVNVWRKGVKHVFAFEGFTPRCAVTEEHKLVWTNRNKASTVDVLDVHY
jgi:hypothetical protein